MRAVEWLELGQNCKGIPVMDVRPSIVSLFFKLYGEFSWSTPAIVYGYVRRLVKCRNDLCEGTISIDRVNSI